MGKLVNGGMGPFIQREYSDKPPWGLSKALERAISYFLVLLKDLPLRCVLVREPREPIVVIASDAQAESNSSPSAGYLKFDGYNLSKISGWTIFDEVLLSFWGFPLASRHGGKGGKNPIANCEAAVVTATLERELLALAGRQVLWYVDNTTALHGCVKGSGGDVHLDRAIHAVHFMMRRWSIRFPQSVQRRSIYSIICPSPRLNVRNTSTIH